MTDEDLAAIVHAATSESDKRESAVKMEEYSENLPGSIVQGLRLGYFGDGDASDDEASLPRFMAGPFLVDAGSYVVDALCNHISHQHTSL